MDANGVSVRNNTNNRKSLSFLFVYVLVLAYQALNDDIGQRNIRGNDVSETISFFMQIDIIKNCMYDIYNT